SFPSVTRTRENPVAASVTPAPPGGNRTAVVGTILANWDKVCPGQFVRSHPGGHLATQETSFNLEELTGLVSRSHDPAETLGNIVRALKARFQVDVCSIYLIEPDRANLVLAATVGLKPSSVGRVRMALHEGLAGLVAEHIRPVTVEDAFAHPRFKYF